MKTGGYAGYAEPILAAGFTKSEESLGPPLGRSVQAASVSVTTSFLSSVLEGGGMPGKFNFGVGIGVCVTNQLGIGIALAT